MTGSGGELSEVERLARRQRRATSVMLWLLGSAFVVYLVAKFLG